MKKILRFINLLSGYQFCNYIPEFVLFVFPAPEKLDNYINSAVWFITVGNTIQQDILIKEGNKFSFKYNSRYNPLACQIRINDRRDSSIGCVNEGILYFDGNMIPKKLVTVCSIDKYLFNHS